MTLTQIEPAKTVEPLVERMTPAVYTRLPRNILADGASSGDHKVIGRLWILGSLLFGLFTLVADVLVRIERLDTTSVELFTNRFAFEQWFSLHRVSLVFLFVVPLLIGIALVMVPLQIGAPSVAFPRAAAAALWTWAVSGVLMVVSWAIDGGLIDRDVETINGPTQLSMLALAGVVLAILVASMVIVTTIFTERSQGMSLYNVPLFTWSMLVAGSIWLLSLPVLVANLIVNGVDARGATFLQFGGAKPLQPNQLGLRSTPGLCLCDPCSGPGRRSYPRLVATPFEEVRPSDDCHTAFGVMSFGAYAQTYFNVNATRHGST